jgi:hypothetical protein
MVPAAAPSESRWNADDRLRYRVLAILSVTLVIALALASYGLWKYYEAPEGIASVAGLNFTAVYTNNTPPPAPGPIGASLSWVGTAPSPLSGPVGSEGTLSVGFYNSGLTNCTLWAFWVPPPFHVVTYQFWSPGPPPPSHPVLLPVVVLAKQPTGIGGFDSVATGLELNVTLPSSSGNFEFPLTAVLSC